jgi:hypothetical protein
MRTLLRKQNVLECSNTIINGPKHTTDADISPQHMRTLLRKQNVLECSNKGYNGMFCAIKITKLCSHMITSELKCRANARVAWNNHYSFGSNTEKPIILFGADVTRVVFVRFLVMKTMSHTVD